MKALERAWIWCRLLNRRLLRRPLFLILLLLIPALALGLNAAAAQGSGVVTVALCPGREDAVSQSITETLLTESGALRYLRCDSPEEARELVRIGGADTAWIFAGDTEAALRESVSGRGGPAVTVVEREGNVFLQLTREKLYAALYPQLSRQLFAAFLSRESGRELNAAELEPYYTHRETGAALVRFENAGGAEGGADYLRSPLRGLLSILIVLSGLSGAALLASDRRRGRLVWTRPGAALPLTAAWVLLPMLDTALAVWLAMGLSGLGRGWAGEALWLLLLVLSGGGLCALLGGLCRRPEALGLAALLLTVAMLALCPVFLDLQGLRGLSALLPPTAYLRGDAPGLLLYAAVTWLLAWAAVRLRK